MLLMAIYNGFLYLAVRDPAYLAYIFAVGSGALFIMALNGHAYQYLWPGSPRWANTVIPLSSSLWVVFTTLFTQIFLETRRYTPLMWRLIVGLMVAGLVSTGLALLVNYQLAIRLATGLALLSGLVLLITSVLCWLRGNRSARFFAVAWVVFFSGTAMLILSRYGVLPDNAVTHNSAALGLLVEIVVLSLALSDKYRLMAEALSDYSRNLEQRVVRRTKALESANIQLEQLSQRDPLTQLANRRRLDADMEHEWQRHLRSEKSLALLFCDVDFFKGLNDRYGHAYGDDCLRQVAESLRQALRRPADLVARFGGDELVVMLPETDAAGARRVADRITAAIRLRAIAHVDNLPSGVLTLSIGAAAMAPAAGQSPASLFDAADQALLRAKQAGRDRVVVAGGP
jgi:diguanylate cyclase